MPLEPLTIRQLLQRGYRTTADIAGTSPAELASALDLPIVVAQVILQTVAQESDVLGRSEQGDEPWRSLGQPHPRHAAERPGAAAAPLAPPPPLPRAAAAAAAAIVVRSASQLVAAPPAVIITFCRALDTALGGGVALGELCELVGEPGAGKTQLALQLAFTAQIPPSFHGVGGRALYLGRWGRSSPLSSRGLRGRCARARRRRFGGARRTRAR